eukprot:7759489-Alexandrium_andersonii.AAC.1
MKLPGHGAFGRQEFERHSRPHSRVRCKTDRTEATPNRTEPNRTEPNRSDPNRTHRKPHAC